MRAFLKIRHEGEGGRLEFRVYAVLATRRLKAELRT